MITVSFGREYSVGDLAMIIDSNGAADLVEVLGIEQGRYNARFTRMEKDPATGLYKVVTDDLIDEHILENAYAHPLGGSYGFVRPKNLIRLRPDNVDFSSIGIWQEFRIKEETLRAEKLAELQAAA
jgi:hypothetical protein